MLSKARGAARIKGRAGCAWADFTNVKGTMLCGSLCIIHFQCKRCKKASPSACSSYFCMSVTPGYTSLWGLMTLIHRFFSIRAAICHSRLILFNNFIHQTIPLMHNHHPDRTKQENKLGHVLHMKIICSVLKHCNMCFVAGEHEVTESDSPNCNGKTTSMRGFILNVFKLRLNTQRLLGDFEDFSWVSETCFVLKWWENLLQTILGFC